MEASQDVFYLIRVDVTFKSIDEWSHCSNTIF